MKSIFESSIVCQCEKCGDRIIAYNQPVHNEPKVKAFQYDCDNCGFSDIITK